MAKRKAAKAAKTKAAKTKAAKTKVAKTKAAKRRPATKANRRPSKTDEIDLAISKGVELLNGVESVDDYATLAKSIAALREIGAGTTAAPTDKIETALTIADLAEKLGFELSVVDSWRRQGLPRRSDKKIEVFAAFRWYVQKYQLPDEHVVQTERQTKEEILIAKRIKREEMEGRLCRVDVIRSEIQSYIESMRGLAGRLKQAGGEEVVRIFNEGLDDIESQIEGQ